MKTREAKLKERFNKRKLRVRKHLKGSALKPRLSVLKSNKHIEAQLINDDQGVTLVSASTKQKQFRGTENGKKCKKTARYLGQLLAENALSQNIKEIVFDRGPHKYHGILAEFADGARGAGLKF